MVFWKKKPWKDGEIKNFDYIAEHLTPDASASDEGKVLTVDDDGTPSWQAGGGGAQLYGPYFLYNGESATGYEGQPLSLDFTVIRDYDFNELTFPSDGGVLFVNGFYMNSSTPIVFLSLPLFMNDYWSNSSVIVFCTEDVNIGEEDLTIIFYSTVEFPPSGDGGDGGDS